MKFSNTKALFLVAASLLLITTQASADSAWRMHWQAPESKQLTLSDRGGPGVDSESQAVQFSYALEAGASVSSDITAVAGESRGYQFDASADELAAGVPIHTTAPGAVIRVTSTTRSIQSARIGGAASALNVEQFSLTVNGQTLAATEAFSLLADHDAMTESGVGLGERSVGFRVDPRHTAGTMTLRNSSLSAGSYKVLIHEPDSPYVLRVLPSQANYLSGSSVSVRGELHADGQVLSASFAEGYLLSPLGQTTSIGFVNRNAAVESSFAAPETVQAPGLWEVFVAIRSQDAGLQVYRDARTAFAIATPTAGISGAGSLEDDGEALRVSVPIAVACSGRYELRALISGTDVNGALQPLAVSHAAANLKQGGQIELSLPHQLLAQRADLHPPYVISDLRLMDQGRLGFLQQIRDAAVIHID